jgi:glycosyltransferase involved in cell wall biosynthesis
MANGWMGVPVRTREHRPTLLARLVGRCPEPAEPSPGPVGVLDVELSRPVPPAPAAGWVGALVFVRLHGRPLGPVHVSARDGRVEASAITQAVETELGAEVQAHLRRDGIRHVDEAPPAGEVRHRCGRDLDLPTTPPLVTVVVATRDRHDQLSTCLRSILDVTYPSFEVVVVDNAPSDRSTERTVDELATGDRRVRYVRVERPGASPARNLGARLGRGEIVAFTDDDAVVDAGWLAALVAGLCGDRRVACVTGLTMPSTLETPAQQAFEAYGGMGLGFRERVYDLHEHRGDTRLYPFTAGVFGAANNVGFRRHQFLERGGFDEVLGPATPAFGAEDLDVFLSLILDGHRIVYQPAAIVHHEHRRDFPGLYWQVFTYSAGFTALLTKWVLRDRAVAVELAARVPRLLPAALLRARRGDADEGAGEYPPQLRWLERAGYLYGPLAYARSRARAWWQARGQGPGQEERSHDQPSSP